MSENFLTVPLQIYSDTVSEASTDGDLEYQDLSIRNPSYKHKKLNHSSNPNQKMKTSLCRKFSETGYCPYGTKCQFAHGLAELRCVTDENKYKTKSCHSFSRKGFCQYGPRCNFENKIIGDLNDYRQIVYIGKSSKGSRVMENLK